MLKLSSFIYIFIIFGLFFNHAFAEEKSVSGLYKSYSHLVQDPQTLEWKACVDKDGKNCVQIGNGAFGYSDSLKSSKHTQDDIFFSSSKSKQIPSSSTKEQVTGGKLLGAVYKNDLKTTKKILSKKNFNFDKGLLSEALSTAIISGHTKLAEIIYLHLGADSNRSGFCNMGYETLGNFYFMAKAHESKFVDSKLGKTLNSFMQKEKFDDACEAFNVAPSEISSERGDNPPFGLSTTNH